MTLRVPRRNSLAALDLRPTGDGWAPLPATTYDLAPTPTGAVDSSKYVMDTVERAEIGAVDAVTAAGVHDGERVALGLSWDDHSRDDAVTDGTEFVDKVAVAFPLAEGASVMTMGSERAPVNAWYWRADRAGPYDVLAEGYGDVQRREPTASGLTAAATYRDGRWHVTFERALAADGRYYDFTADPHAVAVAVWEGSNGERGPLKAFSGEFGALELEGVA